MIKKVKNLVSKYLVDTAIDIADREKIKKKLTFELSCFGGGKYFVHDGALIH